MTRDQLSNFVIVNALLFFEYINKPVNSNESCHKSTGIVDAIL